MSRATNRTSNISVTWNFKNPNISRNELINFIHLFREVPSYSRGLSRHCLAISAVSRYFCCLEVFLRQAPYLHFHLSSFIFHLSSDARPKVSREAFLSESASFQKFPERLSSPSLHPPESFPTLPPEISRFLLPLDSLRPRGLRQTPYLHFHQSPARKSPERLFSPSQHPPRSFLKGFPPRVSVLPKVSRLLHLKSRDFCYLSISLRPRGLRQAPYLHFHQSPARKFPERPFSPSQHPLESIPTLPPEISRFAFGTKVIKILDLSPYLPPTRPFAVSPTLSYSPKPVLPISKASPSPTTPSDRIRSSRSSISLHVLSSFHPVLQQHSSVQFITSYNYQVRFPDRSLRIVILPIPQSLSFTNHATRQNPFLSFINLPARLSSSHPVLRQHSSVQVITSYNYQVRFPDRPIRIVILQTGNSQLATQGIARNLKRSAPM